MRAQLEWLKKRFFGGGQGESLDRAQKRAAPAKAFAHLPIAETVEIVPAAVQADPALYERIGEVETFQVDIVPPKLFRRPDRAAEVSAPAGARAASRHRAGARATRAGRLCLAGAAHVDCAFQICRAPAALPAGVPQSRDRPAGVRGSRGRRWSMGSPLSPRGSSRSTGACAGSHRGRLCAMRRDVHPLPRSRRARRDGAGLAVGVEPAGR